MALKTGPVWLAVLILVGCGSGADSQELEAARARARKAAAELRECQQEMQSVEQELGATRMEIANQQRALRASLSPFEVESLKQRGLTDPEAELKSSLASRTDLLPGPSDKGLEYSFAVPDMIFLSEGCVWAPFEEGHYVGYMLLQYRVDHGSISWESHWVRPAH